MLSRFHLVPERNGRTDRQTDRQTDIFAISISRVYMLTRDKKLPTRQSLKNVHHINTLIRIHFSVLP